MPGFNLQIAILILIVFVIITIIRFIFTYPILVYLKSNHRDTYLKYAPNDPSVWQLLFIYRSAQIKMNIDILFRNGLLLDEYLKRKIANLKIIIYLHTLSIIVLLAYVFYFRFVA